MLPDDLLGKLPTLQELIDHPRVREASERFHRSALVGQVRNALEEVGSEVARRAEGWRDATPGDLVDRVIHILDRPGVSSRVAAINATGRLGGDARWEQPPLAEAAISQWVEASTSFCGRSEGADASSASETLRRLAHAESALVTTSYSAAHAAVLVGLLAPEGPCEGLVVGRPDMGETDPGTRLLDQCATHGVQTIEVGVADRATVQDYDAALSEQEAARPCALYMGLGSLETHPERIAELSVVARRHRALLVVALADSPPCELTGGLAGAYASAESACKGGADAVLLRGEGMVGGPRSGLLVGRRDALERISLAARRMQWVATHGTDVPLEATLALFHEPAQLPFTHPVAGLLDTPLENLRTRAERLVPLIAEGADSLCPVAVELAGRHVAVGLRPRSSWGIEITPAEGQIDLLAKSLAEQSPPLLTDRRNMSLLLDLRTVLPRQDIALVAAMADDAE